MLHQGRLIKSGPARRDACTLQPRVPALHKHWHPAQSAEHCSARCVATAALPQSNERGAQLPRAVASLAEEGLNSSRLVVTPVTVPGGNTAASLSYASFEDEYRIMVTEQQVSIEHEADRLQRVVQQLQQCHNLAEKVSSGCDSAKTQRNTCILPSPTCWGFGRIIVQQCTTTWLCGKQHAGSWADQR